MEISIELVPRSLEQLSEEVRTIRHHFPVIKTVNVPDLLRLNTRSWQACSYLKERQLPRAIPHLRAVDFDPQAPLRIAACLEQAGIDEVLVVTGDTLGEAKPVDSRHRIYESSSLGLIRQLRKELPDVKVYAAFDPYRQGMAAELAYAEQKLEAGATGLFTQPFFDLRLMAAYQEQLSGLPVYWGVTTIMSGRSVAYWRRVNRAVFPASFAPTLDWNRDFARAALDFAERHDSNLYFMPIKTDIVTLLDGIL